MAHSVYAITDLHVDYPQNQAWVSALNPVRYRNDTILVAGDISHDLSKIERALSELKKKFDEVFYVTGNHDLWVRDCPSDIKTSIDKFHVIRRICDKLGVHTRPEKVHGVTIVPLFGFWDPPPLEGTLYRPNPLTFADEKLWSDFRFCKWPKNLPREKITPFFLDQNEDELVQLDLDDDPVITFCHFFSHPEQITMNIDTHHKKYAEAWKWMSEEEIAATKKNFCWPNFSYVAGSQLLEPQINSLNPVVHVFGHSHRALDYTGENGTRFVNWPLGYPTERKQGKLGIHGMVEPLRIWTSSE